MRNFLVLAFLLSSFVSFSAPYHGKVVSFQQPDGTQVELKLFGDEYYMRAESLDGYTLIRDKNTGWICYANLSDDGNTLLSTGIIYKGRQGEPASLKNDLSIPHHLDISEKAIAKKTAANKSQLGIPSTLENKTFQASPPVLGNVKGLCLVVDFSDVPGTLQISEFISFCNEMNYSNFGNNGSLRTYYHDISGGLVDYENIVYGYFRAPLTFFEYDQMPYSQGAKTILGQALNWVASQGFDFSTLSTNSDGSIQAINLMYTGYPPNWAEGMWWHMGNYSGFSANGVHSGPYNCSPANDPLELAVVAHENGHMIGKWPDTYKYSGNTGPDGIGSFDLMCWYGSSNNPVPPNPFFRSDAGWKNVVDVTFFNGLVHDTANSLTCYKYRNLNDTNEFFIMENREQQGRSSDIPDEGLTIWHIDRQGNNQTWHHQVYLEHANNDITEHSQACFHAGFNNEFSHTTVPSSDLYNDDPSGLRVWEISAPVNIMTYKIGAGQSAPTLFLAYVSVSNDNNGNGFLEPGEQGNINITASNYGQLNSGNTNITCQAVGNNATYVNVITSSINAGVIAVSQTIPLSFTVNLASNTPLATVIDFLFTISDGTYSTYITKHMIVGQQFIMNDAQFSTCSGVFLDPGGLLSSYADNLDYTLTFLPPTAGHYVKADFQSFDLEEEPNCDYDFLKIYNGPSSSSPLIGKYCGSDSPGTVASTDPSGALTFEFHSDPAVTGEGWVALISCNTVAGAANTELEQHILIAPNPSRGYTEILFPGLTVDRILVTDIAGRLISDCKPEVKDRYLLNLSSGGSGLYVLQIITPQGSVYKKILIEE
ncbi:MAG: M6 family metalloprotease domain-containing protein [Bacteroidales bacterium]